MIQDVLIKLSNEVGISEKTDARDIALSYFEGGEQKLLYGNCAVYTLKGESDKTIMFDAHCDEIGFIVTSVDEKGFVRVASIGRCDARALPSKPVVIHAKQKLKGVFGSVPPHLKGGDDKPFTIDTLFIDTGLGKKTSEYVSAGDIVTFDSAAQILNKNTVCGKSLDNRAGVAVLIETARLLKGEKLPHNVSFLLSWNEEVGLRGAKTAAYELNPECAVSVDVSFGNTPDTPTAKTRKLGSGAMIGVSPVLSKKISDRLLQIANQKDILNTVEVMSESTGTNADVITSTRAGIPCGLVSIPLRSMHSCYETVNVNDIKAASLILAEFAKSGGIIND